MNKRQTVFRKFIPSLSNTSTPSPGKMPPSISFLFASAGLIAAGTMFQHGFLKMGPSAGQTHSSAGPPALHNYDEDAEVVVLDNLEVSEAAPAMSHPQKDVLVTLMAGGISGAVAKSATAPLARLTILYQVQALQSTGHRAPGILQALKQVVHQEGLASLWKGNLATIIHRVPYSAANFTTFEYSKKALEGHVSSDVGRRLMAGGLAGLVACTAAYPLDLVRTRLAAQRDMLPQAIRLTQEAAIGIGLTPGDPGQKIRLDHAQLPSEMKPLKNYKGIQHAFQCILREEGLKGLYRGLNATLLQVTPTLALNFGLYDSFKAAYMTYSQATSQQTRYVSPQCDDQNLQGGQSQSTAIQQELGTEWRSQESSHEQRHDVSSIRREHHAESLLQDSSNKATPARRQNSTPGISQKQPQPQQQQLDMLGSVVCAAGSGLVTSTITFPLDVVRKRLQTQRCSQVKMSVLQAAQQVLQQQGLRGFYSGIVPEYCKVLPGMAIAFTIFEGVKQSFGVE